MKETNITVAIDGCLISGKLMRQKDGFWIIADAVIYDRFRTLHFTEKQAFVNINEDKIDFWYLGNDGTTKQDS